MIDQFFDRRVESLGYPDQADRDGQHNPFQAGDPQDPAGNHDHQAEKYIYLDIWLGTEQELEAFKSDLNCPQTGLEESFLFQQVY